MYVRNYIYVLLVFHIYLSCALSCVQVLEPIDDVKVQVQINTITMKQIKDMLLKESTKAMERDEKIIKLIEDLRKDIMEKSPPEHSLKHEPPKIANANVPFKFKVQFEGATTHQSQT